MDFQGSLYQLQSQNIDICKEIISEMKLASLCKQKNIECTLILNACVNGYINCAN